MKLKKKLKQLLSIILVAAQVTMLFAGCGSKKGAEKTSGSFFDKFKSKFTVTFALPDTATEFEKEETRLPEAVTVKKGTLISDLPASDRTSCVFMGYTYDPEGLKAAGSTDTVTTNLTLYPVFSEAEGMTNVFNMNFVSGQDVADDYTIELSSYGLKASDITGLVTVKDLSKGGEEVSYVLEETGDTFISDLNISEATLPYVKNAITSNENDPSFDLSKTLKAMGLDTDTIYKLILIYAPEEREAFLEEYAREIGAKDGFTALQAEVASIGSSTESELKARYGLPEDDSLERYWREDLGYDIEDVLRLGDIVKANSSFRETSRFTLKPAEEGWNKGDLFQVEILNTERIRFVFGEEICTQYVTYYNFTVGCEEIKNMSVDAGVLFIPLSSVDGVTLGSMFSISVDENGNQVATEKEVNGVLTYTGDSVIQKGTVIAVYDGTLNEDKSVDGEVGYFEITEVKGNGKYAYQSADFKDVVALPEIIPVSFEKITEGTTAVISSKDLKFDKVLADALGFEDGATIDVGDYIAFYNGTLGAVTDIEDSNGISLQGYAKVLTVEEKNGEYTVTFETATIEEVISSTNLHMTMGEVKPEINEIDEAYIKQSMLAEIERSNLVEEASDYLCDAILSDDADLSKYKNKDKLAAMTFKTGEGEDITFEEVRKLASGGEKVKVDDISVTFLVGPVLQHFEKRVGLRAEAAVSLKITISLGSGGNLEITPMIVFEQEVLISPSISVNAKWYYALGFIPIMRYIDIDPSFECGTYTGFGLNVTIMTVAAENDDDSEFSDMVKEYNDAAGDEGKDKRKDAVKNLIKAGDKLKERAEKKKGGGVGGEWSGGEKKEGKESQQDFKSPGVGGDLPTKYSSMLGNDAEYIDLVNLEIGTFATPVDPFHLVEFSIGAYFVVSFKLNAMIGAGVTYENAKKFTYHIRKYVAQGGTDEKSSGEADLATPNFRADFYAFGMIGIRVGIRIDVRLGIISTKLASIGVTAEVGVYAEVYGFLYVWYEWTSGKGSTSGAMGSLYFEVGIYLDINFKAQLGDGKYETGFSIYSKTWPLLKLGAEAVPLDFTMESNDEALSVKYKEGERTVKLPDKLYEINMMEMKSGEVSAENMDAAASCGEGKSFTMRGRTYTQYDEEHFVIECYDTDKDGNRLDTCSFIYLPATNEIMVKPADSLATEVWGEVSLTYKNNTFGFNTMKIRRIVKLYWKGSPASATVEYYKEKEPGSYEYDLVEEGEFDGFNGIEYDLIVDEDFTYKYEGYRLHWVDFNDTELLAQRYYELLAEYDDLVTAYRRNGKDPDKVNEMSRKLDAAFENYNNYGQNIVDTVKKGEGTLYFLMASSETVVKVYYHHITNKIEWRVWGDSSMDGSLGTMLGFGVIEDVPQGANVAERLTEAQALIDEYADSVTLDRAEYVKSGEKETETGAFTDKITMGKEGILVDYYVKAKPYKLTWMLDGDVVKEEEITAYKRTALTPPEITNPEGYTIKEWDTSDMVKGANVSHYIPDIYVDGARYVMPARDAVIKAVLKPAKYTVEWYTEDILISRCTEVEYGSVISQNPWFPVFANKHMIAHWYLPTAEGDVELDPSMTMPAGDIKLYLQSELIPYTATFMDGNTVVATVDEDENGQVTTPNYRNRTRESQGYKLMWMFHAPEFTAFEDGLYDPGAKVYMPYADVTFTAEWQCAKHRWDEGKVTKEASCTSEGEKTLTCLNCGEKKKEKIEATGHDWGYGTTVRSADCGNSELLEYTCSKCGEKKTETGAGATGAHTYGAASYVWGNNHLYCTGTKTCSVCNNVLTETTSNITEQVLTQPTGSTPGTKQFTATFSGNNGFVNQTDTINFTSDTSLYYRTDTAYEATYTVVSGDTLYLNLVDIDDGQGSQDDIDNIPFGTISDYGLMVYDGNTYSMLYHCDGVVIPSGETVNTFGDITLNTPYAISFTIDDTFPGYSSYTQTPPVWIVFTKQ